MFPTGLELLAIPAFILGLLFLYKGSDMLVDGTVKTASQIGVSALIISVLLVGFGTSAPEFAISVGAAAQGESDISLGNIIGSCIANLFLVLGISAIIKPIKIKKGIIGREMPIMIGATIILLVCSFFGLLDQYRYFGGILFLVLFVIFVWFFISCAKKERIDNKYKEGKTWKNIFFIFLGIAGVVLGAWFLIESSVTIANIIGIPYFVIAASMIAIGTSLPELVVSAVAAYKDESDVAVGNVLGSNVFNILLILGFAALFVPLNALKSMDAILILVFASFLMLPIIYSQNKISRLEGVLMLVFYSGFIWYIFSGFHFI